MTRVAVVADVHVGNPGRLGGPSIAGINRRGREVLGALDWAAKKALELGCGVFVSAGDLFDTDRPSPQLVRAVQRILENVPAVLLLGNHEQTSTEKGDHALGPLSPVATIVEDPTILRVGDAELWLVPFRPTEARPWIEASVESLLEKLEGREPAPGSLLVLHAGISTSSTPTFLVGAKDQIGLSDLFGLLEQHKVGAAVAGNWHEHHVWEDGRMVAQVGALAPTGWDNPGLLDYGWMVVYDTETRAFESYRVPGPRFLDVDGPEALERVVRLLQLPEDEDDAATAALYPYVRWVAGGEELATAKATVRALVDRGVFVDGVAEPDGKARRREAAAAAEAARSSDGLREALVRYTAEMPVALPEGSALTVEAMRAEILSRSIDLLGL